MTNKQKRFCEEYLIDCNATQAAIRAGYSKQTARQIGEQNLSKLDIKQYIDEHLAMMKGKSIADAKEVMEYLTSVLRGESTSEVLAMCGDGCQEVIEKHPDEREKTKAAELLAKRYGLLTDKVNLEGAVPVVICDDVEEDS